VVVVTTEWQHVKIPIARVIKGSDLSATSRVQALVDSPCGPAGGIFVSAPASATAWTRQA
jgi:hypothetical protein